jgi:hypothetical protein
VHLTVEALSADVEERAGLELSDFPATVQLTLSPALAEMARFMQLIDADDLTPSLRPAEDCTDSGNER